MSGLIIGDRVRVIGNTKVKHHFKIGDEGTVESLYDTKRCGVRNTSSDGAFQIVYVTDLELIEECDTMAHNNGDLIKVATDKDKYGAPQYSLYVKFGEFYYDLSKGGQMRGAKNIPKPARGMPRNEVIGNMSGTGDYMIGAGVKDTPEEVADDDCPFDEDSEIEGLLGPTATPLTATEIEMRNMEALKRLKEFNDVFTRSGWMTTDKLSDEELAKKDGYDLMKY